MTDLRIAGVDDAAGIAGIYAPLVEQTAISFEVNAPGAAEIARRIATTLARWPWLVAADAQGILGYAYAAEHRTRAAYRWSVDVSAYVAARARRTGVASRLYCSLFAILKRQGFYNAFAGITLPNEPSVAFHRALGFEPVGVYRNVGYKLGAWHDVSWWQRPLSEPRGAVTEPLAFAAMHDDLAAILAQTSSVPPRIADFADRPRNASA